MPTDLFTLIFENILRIDPSMITKYTALQDQILFLILIPHVILFLFIWGFMYAVAPGHKGLRYLVALITYLFAMIGGSPYSYYGSILIPIFSAWWMIILVVGFIFFIASRIVHPARAREIYELGRGITSKITQKGKKEKKLEKQIRSLDSQINAIQASYSGRPIPRLVEREIDELRRRRAEIEAELSEL